MKNKYSKKKNVKLFRKEILSNLSKLDSKEKSVLREFYLQNQNTLQLPFDQPIVAGLLRKEILKIVGNIGERSLVGMLMSMEINTFIKEEVKPEHIDLPDLDNITSTDKDFIIKNRPDFIPEIIQRENLFHRGWRR
jgi:hypothetical protein